MTEAPTIQEAFEAILSKRRAYESLETAFEVSCELFVEKYGLKPPYSSSDSFRVASNKKMRVRRL